MLDRSDFDKLLTLKFFSLSTAIENDIHLDFPVPSSIETLATFFAAQSNTYKTGVKSLIDRLKSWASAKNLNFSTYDVFVNEFNYLGIDVEENKRRFPLLKDGVVLLAQIVSILESEICPIYAESIVANLITGLSACSPGIYTNLFNAFLQLQSNPENELVSIRKKIAEDVVLEIIRTRKLLIPPIMEMHYVNAVLNLHDDLLSIPLITDYYADKLNTADFDTLVSLFPGEIAKRLKVEIILEQIILKIDLQKLVKNIHIPGYIHQFQQSLNQYGLDSSFKINDLFDQEALKEDEFILSPFSLDFLRYTLLRRLTATGYFRSLEPIEREDGTLFQAPSDQLNLTYVMTKEGEPKPLSVFCLNACMQNDFSLFNLLNIHLQKKVLSLLISSLLSEYKSILSKHASDAQITKEWIARCVSILSKPEFKLNVNQFSTRLLSSLREMSEEDRRLYTPLVRAVIPLIKNDLEYKNPQHEKYAHRKVANYLALFPPAIWPELITSEKAQEHFGLKFRLMEAICIVPPEKRHYFFSLMGEKYLIKTFNDYFAQLKEYYQKYFHRKYGHDYNLAASSYIREIFFPMLGQFSGDQVLLFIEEFDSNFFYLHFYNLNKICKLLKALPESVQLKFIESYGLNQLKYQIKNGSDLNQLLRSLSPSNQDKLLTSFGQDHLRLIISSGQDIDSATQDILFETQQMLITMLGKSHLQKIITSIENLHGALQHLINPHLLLTLLGREHLLRLANRGWDKEDHYKILRYVPTSSLFAFIESLGREFWIKHISDYHFLGLILSSTSIEDKQRLCDFLGEGYLMKIVNETATKWFRASYSKENCRWISQQNFIDIQLSFTNYFKPASTTYHKLLITLIHAYLYSEEFSFRFFSSSEKRKIAQDMLDVLLGKQCSNILEAHLDALNKGDAISYIYQNHVKDYVAIQDNNNLHMDVRRPISV